MGQRLNIEITNNGEVLANAYYHWSGFTNSALDLTDTILNNIDEIQSDNVIDRAIHLLESTNAQLTQKERAYAVETLGLTNLATSNNKTPIDRNDGLIAVSESGMKETRDWEEARVTLDLSEKTIYMNIHSIESKEEFIGEVNPDGNNLKTEYDKLPICDINLDDDVPFENFDELKNAIQVLINDREYDVKLENGDVCSFIC